MISLNLHLSRDISIIKYLRRNLFVLNVSKAINLRQQALAFSKDVNKIVENAFYLQPTKMILYVYHVKIRNLFQNK